MKINSLILLFLNCQFVWSQIIFEPTADHFYNTYNVTISGNGTIYYTLDDSNPTVSSNSGLNNVEIPITTNVIIKAIVKDGQGNLSDVFTKKYFVGEIPSITVYFKPPSSWSQVCTERAYLEPTTVNGLYYDELWPGISPSYICEGWYKVSGPFYRGSFVVNNCHPYSPLAETFSFEAGQTVYYDYQNGFINNPPSCVLNTAEEIFIKNSVEIFPNPVKDILKLKTDKKFLKYTIYDGSGNLVIQKDFSNNEINVSKLSSGMYYLKLLKTDGKIVFEQFIKE